MKFFTLQLKGYAIIMYRKKPLRFQCNELFSESG
jgi:hypothetical protein